MQRCWNWQTGWSQKPVSIGTCGFESHSLHHETASPFIEKGVAVFFIFIGDI